MISFRARVLKSSKRTFECHFNDDLENKNFSFMKDQKHFHATALAKVLKQDHPVVGDHVLISYDESNLEFSIIEVLERKNEIFRVIVRENKKKVISSNVDIICVIVSLENPKFKRGLVDRYLLRAQLWDIPVALVFNKADLYSEKQQRKLDVLFEAKRLEDLGIKCFEYSCTEKDYTQKFLPLGKKDFKSYISKKTILFVGQSGVGKSKMITDITNKSFDLKSSVLGKIGKGKHTTTWSELIEFEDFSLIDSPGIRSFSLSDIYADDIDRLFPDLCKYFEKCKFVNCTHDLGDSTCGFYHLDTSKEKDQLVLSRLESYLKFKEEILQKPEWQK